MANNRKNRSDDRDTERDTNPDPITGSPGSHPVGTGIGAAGGAAAGAAAGALGGPVGAIVGGVAGAVVGGLIGKGVGEAIDPTEDEYWREAHVSRPYFRDGYDYNDYEPAYRLGYNAYDAHGGRYNDELDRDLQRHFVDRRGRSRLEWEDARHAVRDAYERRAQGGTTPPRSTRPGGAVM